MAENSPTAFFQSRFLWPMVCCAILMAGGAEEETLLTGIQCVTDEKGRKVAVQIDLKNTARDRKILGTC